LPSRVPDDSSRFERGAAMALRYFLFLLAAYVVFHKVFPFAPLGYRLIDLTVGDFLLARQHPRQCIFGRKIVPTSGLEGQRQSLVRALDRHRLRHHYHRCRIDGYRFASKKGPRYINGRLARALHPVGDILSAERSCIRPCTEPGFYLIFTSPKADPAHLPVLNSAVSLLTHVDLILFGRAMLARTGVNVQIDADHSRAIWLEIGERLGEFMRRDAACELPGRLRYLMERLAEADRETSPSLVPSLEDMTRQAPIDPRQESSGRESFGRQSARSAAAEPRVRPFV